MPRVMHPTKPALSMVWGAYVRESSEDQGKGFGPEVQTDFCERVIRSHEGQFARTGTVIGEIKSGFVPPAWVYADIGGHGWDIARPALIRLLDDCADGKIDAIVVWRQDRLARTADAMQLIHAFVETGTQVYLEGRMYTENDSLSVKVRQMVSEEELDKMSAAISGGLQKSKAAARRLSRDPLGLRKTPDHTGYMLSRVGRAVRVLRSQGASEPAIGVQLSMPTWRVKRILRNLAALEDGTILEMLEKQRQQMAVRKEKYNARRKEKRKEIREKLAKMAPGKWE